MNKAYLFVLFSTLNLMFLPLNGSIFNKSLALLNTHSIINHKCTLKDGIIDPPLSIKTIVIDAGHGGHDPGCSGANSTEKHLALTVAKKFAAAIRAQYPDMTVILTRDKDVFVPLHERAAIANRARADLFVSIHCNAMTNSKATRGSETYVMGLHTAAHNLNVAKRENNAILLETDYEQNYDYDPNSPEGHILLSMYQNAFLEQSIQFAERVEYHFHATAERKSRGVKQAGFVVLKETAMPSALIEIGFLTNATDEAFLKTEKGQDKVALGLLNAFADYKNRIEGTSIPLANHTAVSPSPTVATTTQKTSSYTAIAEKPDTYTTPSVVPRPANTTAVSEDFTIEQNFNSGEDTPSTAYQPYQSPQPKTAIVHTEKVIYSNNVQSTQATTVAAQERSMQPKGKNNHLNFSVQLAASPSPINTKQYPWNNIDDLIEIIQENNLFKYQIKNLTTIEEAFATQIRLQAAGFHDAFIVSYNNGQRIRMEEARELMKVDSGQ